MSSNDNSSKPGILGQAREYIHDTFQTDKDRQQIEKGQETSVERIAKAPGQTAAGVFLKIDEMTNPNYQPPDKESEKGLLGKAVESVRQTVYRATQTPEEKQAVQEANKDLATKAKDEASDLSKQVDQALHSVTMPLEGKDYADWKARQYGEATEGDAFTRIKASGEKALEQSSKIAAKVDDGLHATLLPIEGKDYNEWKAKKEASHQNPAASDENKGFVSKYTEKVGNLFSSNNKNESNDLSQ